MNRCDASQNVPDLHQSKSTSTRQDPRPPHALELMTLDMDLSFTLNILLNELEHFRFGLKPGIDSKQLRMGLRGAHEALDVLERMADWIDQADPTEWEEVVQEHESLWAGWKEFCSSRTETDDK